MRTFIKICISIVSTCLLSCSSKYLKVENEEQLKRIDEFDQAVKITADTDGGTEIKEPDKSVAFPPAVEGLKNEVSDKDKKQKGKKTKSSVKSKTTQAPVGEDVRKKEMVLSREPELEDSEGFVGRRPIKDPFRVGERIKHSVKYFKVDAGTLELKVDPLVQVNGKKAYSFAINIKSGSMFSKFYSVNDTAVTLMDYDLLIPRVFTLHVKETGQLKEARSFFDFDIQKAKYWEKKVTEKSGIEEKRQEWQILPYSQNVFSALYYMRTFAWKMGRDYAFRVSDDEENLTFKGRAIRKEVLETEAGKFNTIVIKPEVMMKGDFKPVGDIFIWLSDDDRKFILRIESKIKIGTLISEVTEINPGG